MKTSDLPENPADWPTTYLKWTFGLALAATIVWAAVFPPIALVFAALAGFSGKVLHTIHKARRERNH